MATRRATLLVCDNPACDNEYEHSKDDPAPGYHFERGYWETGGGGGYLPKTYACSQECITPAILERIAQLVRGDVA